MYKPTKKTPLQNIYDFVLTNYGSLEKLKDFIDANSLDDLNTFNAIDNGSVLNNTGSDQNIVLEIYQNNKIIVASGSLQFGDFNNDFNNDYNI